MLQPVQVYYKIETSVSQRKASCISDDTTDITQLYEAHYYGRKVDVSIYFPSDMSLKFHAPAKARLTMLTYYSYEHIRFARVTTVTTLTPAFTAC